MSDPRISELIAPHFFDLYRSIKQEEISEAWLKGGRGSTKSSLISIAIMMGLIRDPFAHAFITRRYDNELRESVFGQMEWAADKLNVLSKWRFMVSPMQAICRSTGQKIIFKGADNPLKAKSINLGKGYIKYFWAEEIDQFGGMAEIRSILQSLFRGEDKHRIGFFSYNPPKSNRSWVNNEVTIEKPGRVVHHSDYTTVPVEWLGQRFMQEAEHLRLTNETAYRHEYLGETVGTGLEIFNNVEVRKITKEERESFDKIYQGLDFGYAVDPLCFERMHFDSARRRLYLFDEISGVGISNRAFAMRTPDLYKSQLTQADSAEPKSIDELREYGFKMMPVKKGPGSVEHGIQWLQSLEKIIIDPETNPLAAKEFINYSLETDRTGNVISRYPDKDNHAIDSTRYGMRESMSAPRKAGSGTRIPGL